MTWGDRLRRIRLNRHFDQETFADQIGIAKPTVGKYEVMPMTPRNHRLIENSVELRFGADAAAFLRGRLPHLDSNQEPAGHVAEQDRWAVAA